METTGCSCRVGAFQRLAGGYCVFLLRRAGSRERQYRTSWWPEAFLFLLCRGGEEKREAAGYCGYSFLLCRAEDRERQCQSFQLLWASPFLLCRFGTPLFSGMFWRMYR